MKKQIITALVICLFVLVSFSEAQGQAGNRGAQQGKGNGFGWQGGGQRGNERGFGLFKKLNMTQQQKEKCLERFQNLEKETLSNKQKIESLKMAVSDEIKKESPDKKRIWNSIKEINDNRTVIQQKRIEAIIDIKAGLTPEQKKMLNETSFRFKNR